MKLTRFLADCESLTDAQRWAQARELGQRSRSDPRAAETLSSLAQGNFYQRRLALIAADAADQQDMIAAALLDPSGRLFGGACAVACRKLTDPRLVTCLGQLAAERRFRLARMLARHKRQAVVDRVLVDLPVKERARLLCFATPACVERLLSEGLGDYLTSIDWSRIAAWHAELAIRQASAMVQPFEERKQRAEPIDLPYRIEWRLQLILDALAARFPKQGLSLLQRLAALTDVADWPTEAYASRYPREIADCVAAGNKGAKVVYGAGSIRRLDAERITALVRKGAFANNPLLLQQVDPNLRPQVAAAYEEQLRDKDGLWPLSSMPHLPAERRYAEARFAVHLPSLATQPQRYLPYVAYLPWDEAQPAAARYLSQPDGELRGQALAGLIGVARFEPSRLDKVLELVVSRRNEQDPVRLAMLQALGTLPPSRWQERHQQQLGEVVHAALSARDVSAGTLQSSLLLLLKLLPFRTGFVCGLLPLLAEKTGSFGYYSFENRLNDVQMAQLAPSLMDLLNSWIRQSRHGALFGLMYTFGRRLKGAPPILELLEKLTRDDRQSVATPALRLLLGLDIPGKRDSLIIGLLRKDEGWSTVPEVQGYLSRHRQDWLSRFLTPRRFGGRFSTGWSATFPRFESGFHRWSDQQQETYTKTLMSLLNDAKRSVSEVFFVMRALAAMPAIDIAPLVRLASLEQAQLDQRDKAVEMLGRADGGRGVPALLAALGDERARVAIYALRRAVLGMPPTAALSLLGDVPVRKVTVAKEVLRLAGDLGGEASYQFLNTFRQRPDLHIDIRIALLRALWSHLEREDTWAIFASALTDGTPALARSTIDIPQDGLSPAAYRRLGEHLARLVEHPDPLVGAEAVKRLIHQPIGRLDARLIEALSGRFRHLADRATLEQASEALLLGLAPYDPGLFADLVLARQEPLHIDAVVSAFARQSTSRRDLLRAAAQRLINGLSAQKRLVSSAGELAVWMLPPTTIVDFLANLYREGLFHPGVAERAARALPTLQHERPRLEELEALLSEQADAGLRRLALSVLQGLAAMSGWTAALRQRLERYRTDADPWVHEAASLISLPPLPAAA